MTSATTPLASLDGVERPDDRLNPIGRVVFVLVVVYLIMNRVIPDLMVLPVGFSLRPYEVVLVLVLGAWCLWMFMEPQPMPLGLVGAVGLLLLLFLTAAPFLNWWGLSTYQLNGAERGLFRLFILAGLFLASYHLGTRLTYAKKLLGWVVAATIFQAVLGVWEYITKAPLTFMFDFAEAIGLIFDPNAIRDELTNIFSRQTGELRAATTAPHPIVFSAVVAVALLLVVAWVVYTDNRKTRRWLAISGGILVLALPVSNSRTAFVMLALAAFPLFLLLIDKLPKVIPLLLAGMLALGVAFVLSPETPRLLVDSVFRSDEDPNTQIRLERFERIPELLAPRPVVGAGYLTHNPEIQIFDNAYNLGLIEFGILGLIFTIWWFLCILVRCWTATRWSDESERFIPIAGAVVLIAMMAGSTVFDAWTFDQFFPTCLVIFGVAVGTSDRVIRRERARRAVAATTSS